MSALLSRSSTTRCKRNPVYILYTIFKCCLDSCRLEYLLNFHCSMSYRLPFLGKLYLYTSWLQKSHRHPTVQLHTLHSRQETSPKWSGEILLYIVPYFILVVVGSAGGFLQTVIITNSDVILVWISIDCVCFITFWLLSTCTVWPLRTDAEEVFVDDVAHALQ